MSVPVLGAGGWGSALAVAVTRAGRSATLWARRPDFAARLAEVRENREYLPGVPLPEGVAVTSDLRAAVDGADFALVVVPSVGVPELLAELPRGLDPRHCALLEAPEGTALLLVNAVD